MATLIGILVLVFFICFALSLGLLGSSLFMQRTISLNKTVQELMDAQLRAKEKSRAGWALVSLAVGFACYLLAFWLHSQTQ